MRQREADWSREAVFCESWGRCRRLSWRTLARAVLGARSWVLASGGDPESVLVG